MIKRLFDIVISSISIILVSPGIILLILCSYCFQGGPIFFNQYRIGKSGKEFMLIKFRTMKQATSVDKMDFNAGNKSRITKWGQFLRSTKADEIPQLLNVLKGDMSLVGPRPEVKKWTEAYHEKWEVVHKVRPGITDNASIEFRNEEDILAASPNPEKTYREVILPRKLELYIDYVNSHTFFGDIKIIFRTIKAVLFK